jgi:hypothetical protein
MLHLKAFFFFKILVQYRVKILSYCPPRKSIRASVRSRLCHGLNLDLINRRQEMRVLVVHEQLGVRDLLILGHLMKAAEIAQASGER